MEQPFFGAIWEQVSFFALCPESSVYGDTVHCAKSILPHLERALQLTEVFLG